MMDVDVFRLNSDDFAEAIVALASRQYRYYGWVTSGCHLVQ